MSETVIKVSNLGKKYIIGHQGKRTYKTFREQMFEEVGNIFSKTKRLFSGQQVLSENELEEFWALKDINFEIKQGDRMGIIGKNGAGKSTLLKILSRITEPTTGKISIKGRVASLLEVGTGFHQELTGRENIFLNGAILGMSRNEIKKKFDEIVDFSGVEKFLDTPVKRYSSGMYVRLAFAIAAHLEPEILIVDEVLAVGDSEFQKKCLGKMDEVSKGGRTVLFVSHNLSQIHSLCKKCILLREGNIVMQDIPYKVISAYNTSTITHNDSPLKVLAYFANGTTWEYQSNLILEITWDKYMLQPGWECDIACYTTDRIKVFAFESQLMENFNSNNPEINGIRFNIRNCNLAERNYIIDVGVRKNSNEPYAILVENCVTVETIDLSLPKYKRNDVIVVPDTQIELLIK